MNKGIDRSESSLARRKFLKATAALAATAAFSFRNPIRAEESRTAARFEASHDAMGTLFTIVAYGPDRAILIKSANAAFDEIDRLDAQMSNYKAESELSRINLEAARGAVSVDPRLFNLIAEAVRRSEESGGAFDVTVGPLMKAWGFFRGEGRVPTRAEMARVMRRVGYRHILLNRDEYKIRFDVAGLEVDLGGIGKGYAVDRVVEILQGRGVAVALVSSGASSLYALGAPPGERAWRIHLRDPYDRRKTGDTVRLKNYSLAVSGSFEKFFELQGKTYCHILDPRNGRPVEGMLMTAVLAPRAVESDAISTALFAMGSKSGSAFLRNHPGVSALLYEPLPGEGRFKRTRLKPDEFRLAAESVAEIELR